MDKLTKEEISLYLRDENRDTGVDGINEDELKTIDLDKVPEIILPDKIIDRAVITDKDGNPKFIFDSFTPRSGSIYSKPSFAGSQILMGRVGRKLYFSNGRWFAI